MDKYRLLGVPREAAQQELKRAYQEFALRLHPDKARDASQEAVSRFRLVQEAWETLRDPVQRADYDARLDAAARHVVVSEQVQAADMSRDEHGSLIHGCRCGDVYEITDEELREGFTVVSCGGCSLHIQVLAGSAITAAAGAVGEPMQGS
jgi:diphthamide biosynthesis protein 4